MKKFTPLELVRPIQKTSVKDCEDCPALCCHDLSVEITRPRRKDEVESLKWQLHFDSVGVYIRNRRWHVIIKGRCQYLDEQNLCTIYERRDQLCRKHMPPNCERFEKWYDILFTTPEEMEAYLAGRKNGRAGKRRGKSPLLRGRGKP